MGDNFILSVGFGNNIDIFDGRKREYGVNLKVFY